MTSFLFQYQFSQKKSQFSTSKFTKILRLVWYFVLIFPFLIRFSSCEDVSCFFLFIICWHSWSVWMLHTCWTFAKFASWSLSYQSLFFVFFHERSFSYQNLFGFLELTQSSPRSLSYQVLFLFSFLNLHHGLYPIKYWFCKKKSFKVCATVLILSGFVFAIQVLYTIQKLCGIYDGSKK